MNLANIKTPGVYINEVNGFGNSVVPVATAVPAFIGYTPQASYEGKSYANVPQQITSFAQFQAIYCYPQRRATSSTARDTVCLFFYSYWVVFAGITATVPWGQIHI